MTKPRNKGTPPKAGGKTSQLFVDGTPVDESGAPLTDATISRKQAERMPLDAESARVMQIHKDAMERKGRGESGVKFNGDYFVRFYEAKTLHPTARVRFKMLEPFEDENIPKKPIAVFKDYDDMISYLRDSHWRGRGRAKYTWTVYHDSLPMITVGHIVFGDVTEVVTPTKEDEMRSPPPWYGQPPPVQYPPYGMPPPYGAPPPQSPYGPPPYGMPPQQYGAPPPYAPPYAAPPPQYAPPPYPYPQEHAPPPAPPQAAAPPDPPATVAAPPPQYAPPPMPYGPPGDPMNQFFDRMMGLVEQNALLTAELRRGNGAQPAPQQPPQGYQYPPGYVEWYWQEQLRRHAAARPPDPPAAAPAAPPPPAPKDPVSQARDSIEMFTQLHNLGQAFVRKVAPPEEAAPAVTPTAPAGPENFPMAVKDFGVVRMAAIDGELQRDATTMALMNGDKVVEGIKGIAKELRGFMTERAETIKEVARLQADAVKNAPPPPPPPQEDPGAPMRAKKKLELDELVKSTEKLARAQRENREHAEAAAVAAREAARLRREEESARAAALEHERALADRKRETDEAAAAAAQMTNPYADPEEPALPMPERLDEPEVQAPLG